MNEAVNPMQNTMQDDVRGAAKNAGGQAKEFVRDVKDKASEFAGDAVQMGKEHAGKLGEAAKELASDAAAQVQDAMQRQRATGADYISSLAAAAQRAANEFEGSLPQAAQYIRQASGQIQHVADVVRERDMRELVDEVESFARRQPGLFFGGAVILGFAALRFLKSSSPKVASNAFEQRRAS
jgi:methyl-accepting chemotaxis protein